MASKLQDPKKPPIKHFMSPTISAVSKASAPRKKILAERNESSSFADIHNSKSFPVKQGTVDISDRSSSRTTLEEHIRVSESGDEVDDDDKQNTLGIDSSSKPYDPLMNYLSPRPKFMRYKPNRRREIFSRREREIGHENVSAIKRSVSEEDSSAGAHSSSDASSQEGSLKQDDDDVEISNLIENDQEDDGDEEEEDDDEAEVFEKETCLSLKWVLKFLLLSVIMFLSTLYICSMNSPTPPWMLQSMRDFKDWHHKIHNHVFEVATVEIFDLGRRNGTQSPGDDRFKEEVMVEDNNKVLVESSDELGKLVLKMQTGQIEDRWDSELERIKEETTESEEGGNDQKLEETREGSDQLKEMEIEKTMEKCESFQDLQLQFISDLLDHHLSENEVHRYSSFKDEQMEGEEKPCENSEAATVISEGEVDLVEVTIKHSKNEFIQGAVIGFSILFAITALLISGFYWRRKTTSSSSEKQSLSEERPLSESVLADKISSVTPLMPNLEEQNIEKVESFKTPSSLVRSTEETSKEFYQIQAPRVELLGEFMVGEISGNSLKSCNRKSQIIETESSNNSGFQEEGMKSNVHGASSQVLQTSASEFSLLNSSPSYGSFTAEKKIVKKEEGKDGEVRAIVTTTTPVRRSNRIRNRAVTSP
ncbi:hypothetical protein U1Q18_026921 [Sarracenia purpurea var. burkii]